MRLRDLVGLLAIASLSLLSCSRSLESSGPAQVAAAGARTDCVQVFHHAPANRDDWWGPAYAKMTANLLSHFKGLQINVKAIESYRLGEMNACGANVYIGSHPGRPLPSAFLRDAATSSAKLMWLGANLWQLGPDVRSLFGFEYVGAAGVDERVPGAKGFFSTVSYKGAIFQRVSPSLANGQVDGSSVIARLRHAPVGPHSARVAAEIAHSITGERIPYAIETPSRTFVGDLPFTHAHEADRSFVVADLLFDFLGRAPKRPSPIALVRLQESTSGPLGDSEVESIRRATKALADLGVIAHVTLAPSLPAGPVTARSYTVLREKLAPLSPTIIWRGSTLNGRLTPELVRNGIETFQASGLSPSAWIHPTEILDTAGPRWLESVLPMRLGRSVEIGPRGHLAVQLLPFEINDAHTGERVIPEGLALSPRRSGRGLETEAIRAAAFRGLALRDSILTLYVQPSTLATGATSEALGQLQELVATLREMGYQFESIESLAH